MRRTPLTAALALAAALAASVAVAAAAPAASAGTRTAVNGWFTEDGARIHTDPNFGSTTIGLGYRSHRVTIYCVVIGETAPSGAIFWPYLKDETTGVVGWASNEVATWSNADATRLGRC